MPTTVDKTKVKPRSKPSGKTAKDSKSQLALPLPHSSLEPCEDPELEHLATRIEMILLLPYLAGMFLFLLFTGKNALFFFFWSSLALLVFGAIRVESVLFELIMKDEA